MSWTYKRRRPERVERYTPPERVRAKVYGRIGALRRWLRVYEKRLAAAAPAERPLVELKLRELRLRLRAAEEWARALRAADWSLDGYALAELMRGLITGDLWRHGQPRLPPLEGLPPDLRRELEEALARMLSEHYTVAAGAASWPGLVFCDQPSFELLRTARPSDEVKVYALVKLRGPVPYVEKNTGRLTETDTFTVTLYSRARLSELEWPRLLEEAYRAARELARQLGPGTELADEPCIIVKPTVTFSG